MAPMFLRGSVAGQVLVPVPVHLLPVCVTNDCNRLPTSDEDARRALTCQDLATRITGLAWAACGLLLAVASLGITLVFLAPAPAAGQPEDEPPPVRHPPVPVVAAHITAACITILLATLAAIGSG